VIATLSLDSAAMVQLARILQCNAGARAAHASDCMPHSSTLSTVEALTQSLHITPPPPLLCVHSNNVSRAPKRPPSERHHPPPNPAQPHLQHRTHPPALLRPPDRQLPHPGRMHVPPLPRLLAHLGGSPNQHGLRPAGASPRPEKLRASNR